MKTTIHTIFAALLTGATLLSSCDDYLTTLPSDSLVSEGAITTEEDTKTAVNGLYEGLISVGDSYYYGTDFITRPEVGGEDILVWLAYLHQNHVPELSASSFWQIFSTSLYHPPKTYHKYRCMNLISLLPEDIYL